MRLLLLLLPLLLCTCGPAPTTSPTGDPGYAALLEQAETAENRGEYIRAAQAYRRAYDLRPNRTEHVYRAAELFARGRAYMDAADAYSLTPADPATRPLLALSHGRALKQAGNYAAAESTLTEFLARYNSTDRAIVEDLVNNELRGIALARNTAPADIPVSNLGRGVNSSTDERSPAPAALDRLLFASTGAGDSRVLISRRIGADWQRGAAPAGFPILTGGQFGTGTFSAGSQAFFFTICGDVSGGSTNNCTIYRTSRRLSGAWEQPEKLGISVNLTNSNNAYPSAVTLEDGRQVLYFSSDRPGGRGGLDVYRATQIEAGNLTAFGDAVLLGPAVNTTGDEITPVFDRSDQELLFASNGHPGYGGFDLFSAKRSSGNYTRAVNLGAPINSPADDRGLTLAGVGGQAYLYSNRAALPDKPGTTDDDIFQVGLGADGPVLRASVYNANTRDLVPGVEITLLQINAGNETQVAKEVFADGNYLLALQNGASYKVILRRPGYQAANYQVRTDATGAGTYGRPIYLTPTGAGSQVPGQGGSGQVGGGSGEDPDREPAAAALITYRIQISATRKFDSDAKEYAEVRKIAELRSEAIPGRDLKRVTVGYYDSIDAARSALTRVQQAGFKDAFIVRYERGVRFGRIR